MKLPNAENVSIPREKLTKYILSETHPVGKFKAKLFRHIGFDETNISILQKELKEIARLQKVKDAQISHYGTKYIIDGEITSPSNTIIKVRTVWIIETEKTRPRFVTVYPV